MTFFSHDGVCAVAPWVIEGMATNRIPARRVQRVKVTDENANANGPVLTKQKTLSISHTGGAQRIPIASKAVPVTAGTQRSALGEVTINHRKELNVPSKVVAGGVVKRSRSSSLVAANGPLRVPVPPSATSSLVNRPATRIRVGGGASKPTSLQVDVLQEERTRDLDIDMQVVEPEPLADKIYSGIDVLSEDEEYYKTEVEAMIGVEATHLLAAQRPRTPVRTPTPTTSPIPPRYLSPTESPPSVQTQKWPAPPSPKTRAEIQRIREEFVDSVDNYDTTMVAEYSDEIFEYMGKLEEESMPGESYVDGQEEITWEMRQTLVDWLLQVHLRYKLLPETLWIAINIIDRFLTKRVVSLVKLQLVGITAMFIAAKYEEILAPSVEEFVFMTENGYQKDEIIKGERIILQTLDFRISSYCSPYSWVRRISRADDYDLQTRTLSKFLMEVTLLDYRFLGVKPSMIAAIGMYSARRMLGGDWNESFIYYSGFTEAQLRPGHDLLVDKLAESNFENQYIYRKYTYKRFLKASCFARSWALSVVKGDESDDNITPQ
ncbi:cyclin [Hysterangium stoloniferum]|nr:cyclin [Hysterangium stoloniferum]